LCINTSSGMFRQMGSLHASGRWVAEPSPLFSGVGDGCKPGEVFWQRPSNDTPICVGQCDATAEADAPRPSFCPSPLTSSLELPSVCENAKDRTPAQITMEEKRGIAYFTRMQQRDLMTCGGSPPGGPAGIAFKGCKEHYCPDGTPQGDRAFSRLEACTHECSAQDFANLMGICQSSCWDDGGEMSPLPETCLECRRHCISQCQCREFCTEFPLEAGLCIEQGGRWEQSIAQDFDNVKNAFVTLFEISTTEGWVDVMYAAVDGVDPYRQPQRDNGQYWSLAFCIFIMVGNFFFLNLCVGVIVDSFNDLGEDEVETPREGETQEVCNRRVGDQKSWISACRGLSKRRVVFMFDCQRVFFGLSDLKSAPRVRVALFKLVTHPYFENFIMACIILNTIFMGMVQFPKPEYEPVREVAKFVFAFIFTTEMFMKLFALRGNYFRENWNIFDLFCVMATITGITVELATKSSSAGNALAAIRAIRIARLFRLVRCMKGVGDIFSALILSLPKLGNVGAVLLLFFFLFSVLGVQLFAPVKFHGVHSEHANFRDFFRAFITLLRSVTGEAWNELMHVLARNERYFVQVVEDICSPADVFDEGLGTASSYEIMESRCLISHPNRCGNQLSYPYWIFFTAIMSLVILNLVIAVILEAFDDTTGNEPSEIVETAMERWKGYDPDLKLRLNLEQTLMFIYDVAHAHGVDIVAKVDSKKGDNAPGVKGISMVGWRKTGGKADFDPAQVPMRMAKICNVRAYADGSIHFLYAVKMALCITIATKYAQRRVEELPDESMNVPKIMKDFEMAERQGKKMVPYFNEEGKKDFEFTEEQDEQAKKILGAEHPGVLLAKHIALLKIEGMVRKIKARRAAPQSANPQDSVNEEQAGEAEEEDPPRFGAGSPAGAEDLAGASQVQSIAVGSSSGGPGNPPR